MDDDHDTLRSFGARFASTTSPLATPLYDELRAHDTARGVDVALWVPRAPLFPDPAARDRLGRAAVAARGVIHAGLRRLFESGTEPAPWVTYQPAERAIEPPDDHAGAWLQLVADGLAALHRAGLVHGGVLDHDVVVVDGAVRIGGGGIWQAADPAGIAAAWDPGLVAPERRDGSPATPSTDGWALAALAVRWIAGPCDDPLIELDRRHPQLAAVIGPMLADDPALRPKDLHAFADAIRGGLGERGGKRRRKKPRTTEENTSLMMRPPRPPVPAPPPVPPPIPRATPPTPPSLAMPTPQSSSGISPLPSIPAPTIRPLIMVSMKPPDGRSRLDERTPPAPTPNITRAVIRATSTHDVPAEPMARLAPPRAVVDELRRQRRRKRRRPWLLLVLFAVVAIGSAVAIAIVAR
jgi:hypothetical protein